MTIRAPIELHARLARAERVAEDAAEKADAAIEDVRSDRQLLRDIEAKVDAGFAALNEKIDALATALKISTERDAELERQVQSVGRKASGAKHAVVALGERQSRTEEQLQTALDQAAAASKAILANPPAGDELRELRREALGVVRVHLPTIGRAAVLVFVAACVAAASQFYACSPGGL